MNSMLNFAAELQRVEAPDTAASTDELVKQMRAFIRQEAEAVRLAAANLAANEVQRAFTLLQACRGKILTVGVGKSGDIAQKIASTLTSTGTPAYFLHPSDAMHGGLGILASEDVVIAISNSGETTEILNLLPYIGARQVKLIALVGNLNSTLARSADAILNATVTQEACPLNLAPTASTTVALAIGDALALTLMSAKGLSESDFAVNHPAGRLGKRLTLRVSDLMLNAEHNPSVAADVAWLEVIAAISRGGAGAVSVTDKNQRLCGIITDGDLRRAIQNNHGGNITRLKATDFMTPNPVVAKPEMLAFDALRLMEERPAQISVLPVVDEDHKSIGILRLHDIVRSGL